MRIPVHTDADGVVRVSGTRVTLETIVGAFDAGATPEEIAQQYSSVPLKDVHAVIAYGLQREPEVRAHLQHREQFAVAVRGEKLSDSVRLLEFVSDSWLVGHRHSASQDSRSAASS